MSRSTSRTSGGLGKKAPCFQPDRACAFTPTNPSFIIEAKKHSSTPTVCRSTMTMHLIQKPRGKEKTSIALLKIERGLWISWCLAVLACIECSTPLTHSQQPISRERIRSLSVESNDQNHLIISSNDWLGSTGLEVPHWMDPLFQPHPDGWYYLVARKISENMVPEVDTTGWDLWRYHPRTEVVEIHATGLRLPFSLTQDSWGNLFIMDAIGPPHFGTRWLQIYPCEDYGWMSSSNPLRRRFNQIIWDCSHIEGYKRFF